MEIGGFGRPAAKAGPVGDARVMQPDLALRPTTGAQNGPARPATTILKQWNFNETQTGLWMHTKNFTNNLTILILLFNSFFALTLKRYIRGGS